MSQCLRAALILNSAIIWHSFRRHSANNIINGVGVFQCFALNFTYHDMALLCGLYRLASPNVKLTYGAVSFMYGCRDVGVGKGLENIFNLFIPLS